MFHLVSPRHLNLELFNVYLAPDMSKCVNITPISDNYCMFTWNLDIKSNILLYDGLMYIFVLTTFNLVKKFVKYVLLRMYQLGIPPAPTSVVGIHVV